nr:RNase H family protein [Rappaport israeli]
MVGKPRKKKPVQNLDLWQQLDQLNTKHNVHWHWIKGHSGHSGNEMADNLANQAIEAFRQSNTH